MSRHEDTDKSKLSRQRDIEILIFVIVFTYVILNLFGVVPFIPDWRLTLLCNAGKFLVMMLPSLIAFWLQGKSLKKLFTIVKGQGRVVLFLLVFKAVLALVAYLAKIEKFYEFLLPNAFYPVIHLIYYIVIVGFVEEFVYRIYIQGTLEEVLGKLSFLAPVISGVIFGLSHSVNNSMVNALINIFVGIVWGYVRYFNKKATFTAMVLNHGLSNELTEIVSIIGSIVLYG